MRLCVNQFYNRNATFNTNILPLPYYSRRHFQQICHRAVRRTENNVFASRANMCKTFSTNVI